MSRYSAYKKFARLHPEVVLAYCWAHQRRYWIKLLSVPHLQELALKWIQKVDYLFLLQRLRSLEEPGSEKFESIQTELREKADEMARERDELLADPKTHCDVRAVLVSSEKSLGRLHAIY